MSTVLMALPGCALLALGLVGCVVPVLPGPVLAYASLWTLLAFGLAPGAERLTIGGVVLVAAVVLDYVLPTLFAKRFKCSRLGIVGCLFGSFVGLFFMPFGVILGPFLGTVAGELFAGKTVGASLKGGVGAFLGFVACLALKLAAVGLFAVWFFDALLA